MKTTIDKETRVAPIDLTADQFRTLGHDLIDRVADLLDSLPERPVAPGRTASELRLSLGADSPMPDCSTDPRRLLNHTCDLLFENSLFNGHPRFWGYITSSAAPIGILGDLLAAAVNPNLGSWTLAPIATEIESQTVRWIAELLGYPSTGGGLLVSGGNMANFVGFLAARTAHAGAQVRERGIHAGSSGRLRAYASAETHTWIQKAADLFGLGTDSIRWIPVTSSRQMDVTALRRQIEADRAEGDHPFFVVGTAGTVSTGVIDPLDDIAELCREEKLWFHVDGAYGGFAAVLPELADDFAGLSKADSIAVDPHKWLYAPLEAGCALVRDPETLRNTFSYHPPYYHFKEEVTNYVDYGPQNSRGFRALKVWLGLAQVGREGYRQLIADDIALARHLYEILSVNPDFETFTHSLSITTFRFVPEDLRGKSREEKTREYLNDLNRAIQVRLENDGELFVSNAVIDGNYVLRACVVNFRTTESDIEALPGIISRVGHETDRSLRPSK